MTQIKEEHLGDGVYAHFDGYSVNLAVNHHLNTVVCLEPAVVMRLIQYFKEIEEIKL